MIFGRFAAGFLVSALALTLGATDTNAADPAGGVYVTTLPSSADVWLDGTYIGRSPAFVSGVAPGRHALTIAKSGWTLRELDVVVGAGSTAFAGTRLQAGPHVPAAVTTGNIVLRAVPSGAKITLDDTPFVAVASQPVPVPVGPHRLAVTTVQGTTTVGLDVLPGTTTNVVVHPARAGVRSAVVAPAEDYLPTDAFTISGSKIVVRYAGHLVTARIGDFSVRFDSVTETYDAAAEEIGNRLYLPLGLLQKLTGDTSN